MTPNRNSLSFLGETEMEILNIVWRRGRASVAEVRSEILGSREVAHNTVQTVMRKLSRKGYLAAELVGKTHYYTPKRSAGDVKRGLLKGVIASVFEGSRAELVRTLAQAEEISDSELSELKAMIDRLSDKDEEAAE